MINVAWYSEHNNGPFITKLGKECCFSLNKCIYQILFSFCPLKKGKDKGRLRTGHEGPEWGVVV
jgi:hypothetical protein